MSWHRCITLIFGTILVLSAAPANAVPCTSEITQFEGVARHSESSLAFGPTAPQSIGAQLGHQPTARSMTQAEKRAQTGFQVTMARAKKFAAQGKDTECMQALNDAKMMFDAR
jgi:hypothetical protein